MRLQTITMHNFRQYKDIDLIFPKTKQDFHIIRGENGVGKTTFLNAINWCLYDDEPHAFKQEEGMRILNLSADEDEEVRVSISVIADNGTEFIFTRTKQNSISEFTVDVKSKNGATEHLKGEGALHCVDDFVPFVIREFFFFDGEHLDNYFLNNKENIKNNIFILSHIDILERMYRNLDKKLKKIRKEAGNLDSKVEEFDKILRNKEDALIKEKSRRKEIEDNIQKSSEKIDKLTKELEGMPDIRNLEKRKQDLEAEIEKCEDKIAEINIDKSNLIISSVPSLFMHNAIKSLYTIIEEKEKKKELPYQVDEEIIEESLEHGICKVCNRKLEESSENFLRNSLTNYKLSSDQSRLLLKIKPDLNVSMKVLNEYPNNSNILSKHYKDINDNLNKHERELNDVLTQYMGYEEKNEEIIDKFNLRENLSNSKDMDFINLGKVKNNIERITKEIGDIKKNLQKAMEHDKKLNILRKKMDLCSKARDLAKNTKNEIMNSTKEEIENFTRTVFFDLIWKVETYENVIIDNSYQLQLIHKKLKKNVLGTASASERELLSLAFTLGIHSISGFDGPLLIDTPLARISGKQRINFVNSLIEISNFKQIIIIVTPDEYSENIAPILNKVESRYEIIMNKDESISQIVEME